jgi:hypothetical protein
MQMSVSKGNIVVSNEHGTEALVLALTKDGKRAKLHVFGHEGDIWRPLNGFTVSVNGLEKCWKCQGSGLYYFGGPTVNGVYQGKTGPCFACEGKGKQHDGDRLRNHGYWHRGRIEERPAEQVAAAPEPEAAAPEAAPITDNGVRAAQRRARRMAKRNNEDN